MTKMLLRSQLVMLTVFVWFVLFSMGCPPSGNQPDGGSPDDVVSQLKCDKGDYCLSIGNDGVRSCDIMLELSNESTPKGVGFGTEVRGRSMQKGKRLGLSFLLRKNEAFSASIAAAIIRPNAEQQTASITKATCYDEKGKPVDDPKLNLEKR